MRNKKMNLVTIAVISLFMILSCAQKRQNLWNGVDFNGWKLFIPDENIDVNDIWSVRDGVIHCKGVPNGYMRTEEDFSNYKLHVEWRWVEKPSNSGVLLHTQGEDKVWPDCIECQLFSGKAGDFVLISTPSLTVNGEKKTVEDRFCVIPKRGESAEKEIGEWNAYDIECVGGSIRCFVNGELKNEGENASVTSGNICLQSEGAPIEFRNIYIEPAK